MVDTAVHYWRGLELRAIDSCIKLAHFVLIDAFLRFRNITFFALPYFIKKLKLTRLPSPRL